MKMFFQTSLVGTALIVFKSNKKLIISSNNLQNAVSNGLNVTMTAFNIREISGKKFIQMECTFYRVITKNQI